MSSIDPKLMRKLQKYIKNREYDKYSVYRYKSLRGLTLYECFACDKIILVNGSFLGLKPPKYYCEFCKVNICIGCIVRIGGRVKICPICNNEIL